MWCDDFDMDLLKVFPTVDRWFQQPLVMWALCQPSQGKINCPAMWNGFGVPIYVQPFSPTYPRNKHGWLTLPGGLTASDPWVQCSPLELVRDEWVHNGHVWLFHQSRKNPLGRLPFSGLENHFHALMYHYRGYRKGSPNELSDEEVRDIRFRCLKWLWTAARVLDGAVRKVEAITAIDSPV